MKAIANFFLRAKHWQIFLLLYAPPTVAEFSAVDVISATLWSWYNFGPGGFFFLGVMVLYLLCFLAWFGSMGLFFRSIVKPELRMETQFFRFALVYPVVYVPIFFFLVIPDTRVPVWIILPLHLACTVCLFYLLYFVSKILCWRRQESRCHFTNMRVHFFSCGFFLLGCGLSSRRSIGFTQRKAAQEDVRVLVDCSGSRCSAQ